MKTALLVAGLMLSTGGILNAAEAKENWGKHCAKCHGMDGKGKTKMGQQSGAKDYTDPKVQAELKDDNAIKVIKEGLTQSGKKKMDAYAEKLSDEEIKALVAYIRAFKK
jgi:cytochrome c553